MVTDSWYSLQMLLSTDPSWTHRLEQPGHRPLESSWASHGLRVPILSRSPDYPLMQGVNTLPPTMRVLSLCDVTFKIFRTICYLKSQVM